MVISEKSREFPLLAASGVSLHTQNEGLVGLGQLPSGYEAVVTASLNLLLRRATYPTYSSGPEGIMRGNRGLRLSGLTLVALILTTVLVPGFIAGPLTFSVNLLTGSGDSPVPP